MKNIYFKLSMQIICLLFLFQFSYDSKGQSFIKLKSVIQSKSGIQDYHISHHSVELKFLRTGLPILYYQMCDKTRDSLISNGIIVLENTYFFDSKVKGRLEYLFEKSFWTKTIIVFNKRDKDEIQKGFFKFFNLDESKICNDKLGTCIWTTKVPETNRSVSHTLLNKKNKIYYFATMNDTIIVK